MKVSIIIVNYNVKYFLDQCIASILQSDQAPEYEIVVVDNASTDGSAQFIKRKYPMVHYIENSKNLGFSRANNMGVAKSTGDHILILNPDTLLKKDTLYHCSRFYLTANTPGLVGVKMFDGSGQYLPESKRGFPTPFVSFSKLFGLSAIFPSSKYFNRYYLGYLSANENHPIDILTGAFMFTKRSIFEEVGGFDEDYFMYGEDIDLSYCVSKAGYQNYYLADTSIIHYKGESTRKMSFDYVRRFYEAMMIFARKHTSSSRVLAYSLAIRSAIYLNAFVSFLIGLLKRAFIPIRDAVLLGGAFIATKEIWEEAYFEQSNYFPTNYFLRSIAIYIGVSLTIYLLFGKYHQRFKKWRSAKILLYNLLALLAVYSLLPGDYRFSRVVLLFGGVLGSVVIYGIDLWFYQSRLGRGGEQRKTAVVGGLGNSDQLLALLDKREQSKFVGFIRTNEEAESDTDYIGQIDSIESIIRFHGINELIFDLRAIDSSAIMRVMTTLDHSCQFKIYTSETASVVGSYSKEFRGQIDTFDIEYEISSAYSRFIKRFSDVLIAILLVPLAIVLWPINRFRWSYWQHIGHVLSGSMTWVGYLMVSQSTNVLPSLKPGVVPHDYRNAATLKPEQKINLNFIYAREYTLWIDVRALVQQINQL